MKKNKVTEETTRWTQTYEYEDCITIFKYERKEGKIRIYEVEIKYKK